MRQVKVTQQAEALYGLIQRRNRLDVARLGEIRRAFLETVAQLGRSEEWIWLIKSDRYPDAALMYQPPLKIHFRLVNDDAIGIVDIEEIRLLDS